LRAPADAHRGQIRAALLITLIAAGCAPAPLKLPSSASVPLSDATPIAEALARCAARTTLAAEIGLSGNAAGQRLRGTLHAGFAPPDALRLEAVAPFGGPVFVLAGKRDAATLLLTREGRVVTGAPEAILEALVGLRVAPSSLQAWVSGCPSSHAPLSSPRRVGDEWLAADLGATHTVWLRRLGDAYVLAAETEDTLTIEFSEHAAGVPRRVRLRQARGADRAALDIRLALDQVEHGVALGETAFSIDLPDDAAPLTLEELRSAGPLRDIPPSS
jgi:outer membrane biogenesis lipoprotein LolB